MCPCCMFTNATASRQRSAVRGFAVVVSFAPSIFDTCAVDLAGDKVCKPVYSLCACHVWQALLTGKWPRSSALQSRAKRPESLSTPNTADFDAILLKLSELLQDLPMIRYTKLEVTSAFSFHVLKRPDVGWGRRTAVSA